jgi:hypothetical protein
MNGTPVTWWHIYKLYSQHLFDLKKNVKFNTTAKSYIVQTSILELKFFQVICIVFFQRIHLT